MSRRGDAVGDMTEVAQDFRLLSTPLRPGPFLQEFVGKNRRMSVFRSRSARLGAGSNIKCRRPHSRTGKDAAQPVAGFVHREGGFVDDADPEHEAVIDAVIASKGRGDAVCPQLLGVEFALIAQRVVFGSDEQSGWQTGKVRRAKWRSMWMCAFRRVAQVVVPEPFQRVASQAVSLGVRVIGGSM